MDCGLDIWLHKNIYKISSLKLKRFTTVKDNHVKSKLVNRSFVQKGSFIDQNKGIFKSI